MLEKKTDEIYCSSAYSENHSQVTNNKKLTCSVVEATIICFVLTLRASALVPVPYSPTP